MDKQKDKRPVPVDISNELSQVSKDLLAREPLYESLTPEEQRVRRKLWVLILGGTPQDDVEDIETCS